MTRIVKIDRATGEVLAGPDNYTPQSGDYVRITTTSGAVIEQEYTEPTAPQPRPRVLSKTAFQDYAISQLGGGLTGMGRFTKIMDATRDSASGAVRFAFARYEAAQTFEKDNTETLTAVMAADSTAGHLTDAERAAIITNWPVG